MDALKDWILNHFKLTAWLILAVAMNIITIYTARDVGLEGMQWVWLIIIITLVAGACVWIVAWGDEDEEEDAANQQAAD